jgi:hypothetical protein
MLNGTIHASASCVCTLSRDHFLETFFWHEPYRRRSFEFKVKTKEINIIFDSKFRKQRKREKFKLNLEKKRKKMAWASLKQRHWTGERKLLMPKEMHVP